MADCFGRIRFEFGYDYFPDDKSELELNIKNVFTTIVSLDDTDIDGLNRLGWYYFKIENDFSKSEYYLLEAINNKGNNDPCINYNLGKIDEDNQDTANALIYYNTAYINRPEGR